MSGDDQDTAVELPTRPPDPPETSQLLRELIGSALELRHDLARRGGLNDTEMDAMEHLARRPVGPGELATLLGVSTAASTGIVDRLVVKGHAARAPHPGDRRRTVVDLTDSGRADVLELLRPMLGRLVALDADLDEDERDVVLRFLRGTIAAFSAAQAPR